MQHLSRAADEWDALRRPDSELYRGVRLAAAAEWRERAAPELDRDRSRPFSMPRSPHRRPSTARSRSRRNARPGRTVACGRRSVAVVVLLVLALWPERSPSPSVSGLDESREAAITALTSDAFEPAHVTP